VTPPKVPPERAGPTKNNPKTVTFLPLPPPSPRVVADPAHSFFMFSGSGQVCPQCDGTGLGFQFFLRVVADPAYSLFYFPGRDRPAVRLDEFRVSVFPRVVADPAYSFCFCFFRVGPGLPAVRLEGLQIKSRQAHAPHSQNSATQAWKAGEAGGRAGRDRLTLREVEQYFKSPGRFKPLVKSSGIPED